MGDDVIDRDSEMQRKRNGKVRPGFAHIKEIKKKSGVFVSR